VVERGQGIVMAFSGNLDFERLNEITGKFCYKIQESQVTVSEPKGGALFLKFRNSEVSAIALQSKDSAWYAGGDAISHSYFAINPSLFWSSNSQLSNLFFARVHIPLLAFYAHIPKVKLKIGFDWGGAAGFVYQNQSQTNSTSTVSSASGASETTTVLTTNQNKAEAFSLGTYFAGCLSADTALMPRTCMVFSADAFLGSLTGNNHFGGIFDGAASLSWLVGVGF
jgi:hypothetical protein